MSSTAWVKESVFGIWFLNTDIWFERVLKRAIADLDRMLPEPKKRYPLILDVGCGRGNSFELLDKYFSPDQISGIEIDESLLGDAKKQAEARRYGVDLIVGNNVGLPPILSLDQSEP